MVSQELELLNILILKYCINLVESLFDEFLDLIFHHKRLQGEQSLARFCLFLNQRRRSLVD